MCYPLERKRANYFRRDQKHLLQRDDNYLEQIKKEKDASATIGSLPSADAPFPAGSIPPADMPP